MSLTKVYTVIIKFYHIFANELVFTFFFLKYQIHFDMKKSPFKNSGNSWPGGKGGHTKPPWNRKSWGVGGGGAMVGVWIFSGTTQSE